MESVSRNLKELVVEDIPEGLHLRIISKMVVSKFRAYFLAVGIFLVLNFLVLSWHIWMTIIDTEAYAVFFALFQDFEFSFSYISDIVGTLFEIIPIVLVVAFVVNLVLIIYFIHFRFSIKNSLKENLI